jgi:hypothetical protein
MVRSTYREQEKSRDECLQKSNEPGGSRDGCEKALTPIVIFNEHLQLAPLKAAFQKFQVSIYWPVAWRRT